MKEIGKLNKDWVKIQTKHKDLYRKVDEIIDYLNQEEPEEDKTDYTDYPYGEKWTSTTAEQPENNTEEESYMVTEDDIQEVLNLLRRYRIPKVEEIREDCVEYKSDNNTEEWKDNIVALLYGIDKSVSIKKTKENSGLLFAFIEQELDKAREDVLKEVLGEGIEDIDKIDNMKARIIIYRAFDKLSKLKQ